MSQYFQGAYVQNTYDATTIDSANDLVGGIFSVQTPVTLLNYSGVGAGGSTGVVVALPDGFENSTRDIEIGFYSGAVSTSTIIVSGLGAQTFISAPAVSASTYTLSGTTNAKFHNYNGEIWIKQ